MSEFSELLEVSCTPWYLMIAGDMNYLVEVSTNYEAIIFRTFFTLLI